MQGSQLSPNDLPIASHLPNILKALQQHAAVVVSGKTGCGKSTQVPKAIWRAYPSVRIAVCQPRRVAATSLAIRVSQQIGCKLGSSVGYHIGMQSFKNEHCSIVYMTYGILIQELLFKDQMPYTHIILDEIHERSLEMDFSFVALKCLLNRRKREGKSTAKLVVMSATLNSQEFANYFSTDKQTGLFFIPEVISMGEAEERGGRQRGRRGGKAEQYKLTEMSSQFVPAACYDIPDSSRFSIQQIFWQGNQFYSSVEEQPRLSDNIVNEVISIIKKVQQKQSNQGDILIFLPGFFEIQFVKKKLLEQSYKEERIIEVHSIFSEELYEKLFLSKTKNKLILATNIGESSITLPFCKVVIDFCMTKKNNSKNRGMTQLETRFTSKASMTQRAGRVGRVADGLVFRMITKQFYEQLPQYEEPEIKCITLEMVILRAKQLDVKYQNKVFSDPYQFLMGVMNPPNIETIKESVQRLLQQQALVGEGSSISHASTLQLTKIGSFMVAMPCDLQISKMIMMGIKLKIPSLIIQVASIMMATKMFYAHQQRRSNIEEFLHSLVGYDQGLSNDFLLRNKLYQHWKEKFYYPVKEKKLFNKWAKNSSHQPHESSSLKRVYEKIQDQELFSFLQEFSQQKWSERQKDFCFPRGVSLNTLRQIVKMEQNLKARIRGMGIQFPQTQKHVVPMFMLCLGYAFPENDCEVNYSKYIKGSKKELDYIQVSLDKKIDDRDIQDYVHPEKKCSWNWKKGAVRVEGTPGVLKKFIFPQYFHKNSINNFVSPLFSQLAKNKVNNKFQCQILHKYNQTVILNQSINRVLIPPDYSKQYKLLTSQISLTSNKKLIKMCALIQEEMYFMTQLITDRDAKVSMHPSREMLSQFKIGGYVHEFKRVITARELQIIRRLRSVAIRKNDNQIQSSEELMSDKEIETLADFLVGKTKDTYQRQPWQYTFIRKIYGDGNSEFHLITKPLQFRPEGSYLRDYEQWKKIQYYDYTNFYRQLLLQEIHLICGQCPHIEPIQRLYMLDHESMVLTLNEYSGSWEIRGKKLECAEGHQVGQVQNEEKALIFRDKVKIYVPCNKAEEMWRQWPYKEQLAQMHDEGKRRVRRRRQELEQFQCPFCFDKDDPTRQVVILRQSQSQNFWKKLQTHFSNYQHIQNLSRFRKSLRDKK